MTQQPPKKKRGFGIAIIVAAVLFVVLGVVCCGALTFFGVGAAANADKHYYADCEYLESDDACQRCCRERGYRGTVYGSFLNDDDKQCGCMSPSE